MTEFEAYQRALDQLPGVKSYQLVKSDQPLRDGGDGRLRLRTEAGDRELIVHLYRTNLTRRMADHIVADARRSTKPVVILAPHIGAGLAAKFTAAGVSYLDARGNCHIAAPPLYIHIEGKAAAPQARADKGLRSAGYQVLFVYLAEPSLLDAPVRTVAERAGVSRQPVADMRHRLLEEKYVLPAKTKTRWHPRRRQDALALWLHGYETIVRPSLVWGTYRTEDASPDHLEKRLVQVFADTGVSDFRWGGTAAAFRLTGYFRGERTVVHVHAVPGDLQARLRAHSDPRGNLILMDAFGPVNWELGRETVHPLLVYSEMLGEGTERAREAADQLYEREIAPILEREP